MSCHLSVGCYEAALKNIMDLDRIVNECTEDIDEDVSDTEDPELLVSVICMKAF